MVSDEPIHYFKAPEDLGDVKRVSYKTPQEELLERKLARAKELFMEVAVEMRVMGEHDTFLLKRGHMNKLKYLFVTYRSTLRRYISKQMIQRWNILDQELQKMKIIDDTVKNGRNK